LYVRGVLSAPVMKWQIHTLNGIILAVSLISAIGAGWIIISFLLFKAVRTFRHQLILGLAISDFWMAINFMSSTAVNLSGHIISGKAEKPFCSFNGFMTQLFVVQTDYWVFTIALCTFLILANYKHQASWIQEHRIILWCLPWGLSTAWAAMGLGITGYGDIGAWCWFTSDRTRLLVNFIPRWIIIITILGLYIRLYQLIYKAHTRFQSFDNNPPGSLEPETESVSSTRRIGRPNESMGMSKGSDMERSGVTNETRYMRTPTPWLKKMAYQMMSYPLVYMFIWTIPTSIRIYQCVQHKPAPFWIATIDKGCIVVQGFADAIIYGINEASLLAWRDTLSR
ncbi:hypothetical protein K432DRAFT_281173, partial [Lepidopterella palustris CBS 459.81]